ncbi:unnamed protein product [Pleuronectes platessa]|uniref:Uncharacterized protein n=1 Tax=Pleuronectes platessa TaxID=8262 RepID=A0A9N7UDI8_PLEPL|nr:unnamed protein product [Pleuronectes platessa]
MSILNNKMFIYIIYLCTSLLCSRPPASPHNNINARVDVTTGLTHPDLLPPRPPFTPAALIGRTSSEGTWEVNVNKVLASPPLSSPLAISLTGRAGKMQRGIIGRLGVEGGGRSRRPVDFINQRRDERRVRKCSATSAASSLMRNNIAAGERVHSVIYR